MISENYCDDKHDVFTDWILNELNWVYLTGPDSIWEVFTTGWDTFPKYEVYDQD